MTTSATKMHDDELDIDAELVEGLVADQFPRWAGLPVRRVPSAGTENAMFRLGDDMVVRLPRRPDGARQIEKEHRWMPHLAPHLPLAVPEPLAKGVPGPGYALAWGVYRWLEGEDAYNRPIQQLTDAARELGGFITALRQIDATTGPPSYRGGPLTADDDTDVRDAIRDLGADGTLDAEPATDAWESALRLPPWNGAPVWLHSDLLPGNLLTSSGRLTAVIDFGALGTGDPAVDAMAAWTVFDTDTRHTFRDAAEVDDATWGRARGWALKFGLTAHHYYRDGKNPVLAAVGLRALREVLREHTEG